MKQLITVLLLAMSVTVWSQGTLTNLNNMHLVQKGETVFHISQIYGISQEALLQANPDIKNNKIKKGQLLIIPQKEVKVVNVPTSAPQDEPTVLTKYQHINVAVLLPFGENSARAAKLVEFYQGMLMAADSVKNEGTELDIYAIDCGKTEAEMNKVLDKNPLQHMHVIFGPADAEQIPALAKYCKKHDIRLVLPFSNSQTDEGYPKQYTATISRDLLSANAAKLVVNKHTNRNYIILNTNQIDAKGTFFIEEIKQNLSQRENKPHTLNINGDDSAYDAALSQLQENCIIPDNTSVRNLNILFARLNDFLLTHPQYKISVQGYPEWQMYTSNLLKDFYKYNTFIYSSYYRNPLSSSTADFDKKFLQNFGHPMEISYPRYGMMGFDIAYYFLHGMAVLGDNFEEEQHTLRLNPYQHEFKFVRHNENCGFINLQTCLIHYKPAQVIELEQ